MRRGLIKASFSLRCRWIRIIIANDSKNISSYGIHKIYKNSVLPSILGSTRGYAKNLPAVFRFRYLCKVATFTSRENRS